jgi:hypothetical protein
MGAPGDTTIPDKTLQWSEIPVACTGYHLLHPVYVPRSTPTVWPVTQWDCVRCVPRGRIDPRVPPVLGIDAAGIRIR